MKWNKGTDKQLTFLQTHFFQSIKFTKKFFTLFFCSIVPLKGKVLVITRGLGWNKRWNKSGTHHEQIVNVFQNLAILLVLNVTNKYNIDVLK